MRYCNVCTPTSGNILVIADLKLLLQQKIEGNWTLVNKSTYASTHAHVAYDTRLSGLTLKSMNFKIRFSSQKNVKT